MGAMIAFAVVLVVGLWIYTSFAYMEIAKKLKYKHPGLAWIPFARGAMILQLGGFNWALIFLVLFQYWDGLQLLFFSIFLNGEYLRRENIQDGSH